MVLLSLGVLAGACVGGWLSGYRPFGRPLRPTLAVPPELVLWLRDLADELPDAGAARRNVERAHLLCSELAVPETPEVVLAAALPAGSAEQPPRQLPRKVREAMQMRHARWDGSGVPPVARARIPIAAQILAVLEWLDGREGTPECALAEELRAESGRRFSPALATATARILPALCSVRARGFSSDFRMVRGALLCAAPLGGDEGQRRVALDTAAARIRRMLRPRDRVEAGPADLVVWLRDTDGEGAIAVLARLEPALRSLPVSGIDVGGVGFRFGVAVAGADATRFAELLAVARLRSKQAA